MLQFKRAVLTLIVMALAVSLAALPHNIKYERITLDGISGPDGTPQTNLQICVPRN